MLKLPYLHTETFPWTAFFMFSFETNREIIYLCITIYLPCYEIILLPKSYWNLSLFEIIHSWEQQDCWVLAMLNFYQRFSEFKRVLEIRKSSKSETISESVIESRVGDDLSLWSKDPPWEQSWKKRERGRAWKRAVGLGSPGLFEKYISGWAPTSR